MHLITDYFVNVDWTGNGIDYISAPINVTFTAGTNSTTIHIPITKDNVTEEKETFDLSIALLTSLGNRLSVGGTAIGRIFDGSG